MVKLASNENPIGPSPRALEAAHAALAGVNRYPDPQATELRAALSAHLGVPVSHLLAGNGSVEIIDLIARALLGPGDNAVISEHAFVRFRQIVAAHNHGARLVPMREWTHDLAGDGARDRRPHAPRVRREPEQPDRHLEPARGARGAGRRACPRAACSCSTRPTSSTPSDPDYPNGIELVLRGAPVIVTRTFSKVYGLGGLRAGYAVAAPEVLDALLTIREAFGTNSVAQAAAAAALSDHEHVRRSRRAEPRRESARRRASSSGAATRCCRASRNFVTYDTRANGREVFRQLLARGVIVRPLDPYDMGSFLRVSIGTPEENTAFLAAIDAVGAGKQS